jgi:hypothetical protein
MIERPERRERPDEDAPSVGIDERGSDERLSAGAQAKIDEQRARDLDLDDE